MSEIVNLRQFRKSKKRQEKEKTAAENRVKHGRTKAEKDKIKKTDALERKNLDAHKRDKGEDD